jgi:hypothetical protein
VTDIDDGYAAYYAERLWLLLPAVYRTADTDGLGGHGPLRELINRIGAQVADARRGIDRLWADQSIETCDDWAIPYIGDLLGTNLVSNLGAAAQRLDVANTIHYRRRKGTVEILEELAHDITAVNGMRWTAHVVEGFRRLARTRHGLDPAVGPGAFPQASAAGVAQLLQAEGLAGQLTGGLAGGFADLRSSHGAALADTPFDEAFHLADLRAGLGAVGHFGIPKILVFLWRLTSFPVVTGTPVAVANCPGQYVFDPTGRQIPLFLPPPPPTDDYAASWAPAREWQVPGPLTSSLDTLLAELSACTSPPMSPPCADATIPPRYWLGPGWQLTSVWPEIGRFTADAGLGSPADPLTVNYYYGFPSMIGAGPYDRSLLGTPPAGTGAETIVTGGQGLDSALTSVGPTGVVTIGTVDESHNPESLTYTALADVGSSLEPIQSLLVRAGPRMRPVLRPPAGADPWVFTGGGEAELVLDGLTVSGCDIVLRGSFKSVRITACTVDPGTAAEPAAAAGASPIALAADLRPLAPCRIFIEADPEAYPGADGAISELMIDHCVLGPVRTRLGGSVETLKICDSVVQGLPATAGPTYTSADIFDPELLARGLLAPEPLAQALLGAMPTAVQPALQSYLAAFQSYLTGSPANPAPQLSQVVIDGLNALVDGPCLYDTTKNNPALYATVSLSPDVLALAALAATLSEDELAALNRALLDEFFPVALGVAALAVADATTHVTRVTVLGRTVAHRLRACDSILGDFTAVDDVQDGCVRFSAYATGSVLPSTYESATIPPGAPVFTSSAYGEPGYAQLLETADALITGGADGASISSGAENGSEMGVFAADLNPLREQGLLIKYAEYMPLGLAPVIIHVT